MNKETEALFDDDYKDTIKVALLKSGVSIRDIAKSLDLSHQGARNVLIGKGSYWKLHEAVGIIGVDINDILK